jgi:hypothetical protein
LLRRAGAPVGSFGRSSPMYDDDYGPWND